MSTLTTRVRRFLTSEDGPTAVEYAVMLALIVVAIVGTVQALATNLNSTLSNVSTTISGGSSS